MESQYSYYIIKFIYVYKSIYLVVILYFVGIKCTPEKIHPFVATSALLQKH